MEGLRGDAFVRGGDAPLLASVSAALARVIQSTP